MIVATCKSLMMHKTGTAVASCGDRDQSWNEREGSTEKTEKTGV